MDNIRRLKRPINIGGNGLESDLLWSDPSAEVSIPILFPSNLCYFEIGW